LLFIKRFHPEELHSQHRSLSSFVQKTLPHFLHVILFKPSVQDLSHILKLLCKGNSIAFLGQSGMHDTQPSTQFWGFATKAFPPLNAKTLWGQKSMHLGFDPWHPSHRSGKTIGYHVVVINADK